MSEAPEEIVASVDYEIVNGVKFRAGCITVGTSGPPLPFDPAHYVRRDIHCARIEALEARVAALESAIEPFAEAADEADEWPLDDENQAPVDVRQCRAARTALTAYEATKEQSDG